MYELRDYLYDIIDKQKEVINNLKNENTEEVRCINQLKYILSRCINDVNIDIYKKNHINNTNDKSFEENLIDVIGEINEEDKKKLYILTYIYDNCFIGINNNKESIFPEFRSNNNAKIFDCFKTNNSNKIISLRKRCFSSKIMK